MSTLACLVNGLGSDSRLKMFLAKSKLKTKEYLLAGILDRLTLLVYSKTKDAQKGRNKPKLLIDMISKDDNNINSFSSSKDFEKMKNKIIASIKTKKEDIDE